MARLANIRLNAKTSALLALFLFLTLAVQAIAEVRFASGPLRIITAAGAVHDFNVEWALTLEQRARGLMFREPLPDDGGMLFDFGESRMATMWMKDTPSSLDMLFIDEGGTVIKIAERTSPLSESVIGSGGLVRYVLEIRGGRSSELGITAGARLDMPLQLPSLPAP